MIVASDERPLRIMVIHDRHGSGFYVAMVCADLPQEQVESALSELGVDGDAMLELGDWKTTKCGVAVARVPFPGEN